MLKKFLGVGVGIVLFAVPVVTSAATISSLQAELASLLSQLQSLEAQVNASSSASVGPVVSPANPVMPIAPVCPVISRSLSVGSTGSDVTALQQYLSSQGDLSVSATGYFGTMTKAAVQEWQVQNGVAASGSAGSGTFGPLSRSFLRQRCGSGTGNGNGTGTTTASTSFTASPASGAAPLTVQFTATAPQGATLGTTVNFGDGSTDTLTVAPTCSSCSETGTASHTYASSGTYTATLTNNLCSCPANGICNCPNIMILGTATVDVTGNSTGTTTSTSFTASPTFGAAPLTVQFTSTAPQGDTLGTSINFGDGSSGRLGIVPTCAGCSELATASHTYTAAGNYTATLTSGACACPANGICNCPNMMILGSATIDVSASGTGTTTSPNIQQLNAPGSVTLSQTGIAEIRNENFYFTLQSLADSAATIQITPVGCWNSFPSDPPPQVVCMIAMLPIPPQTLTVGQTYNNSNYAVTLTSINDSEATFSVTASSSNQVVVY